VSGSKYRVSIEGLKVIKQIPDGYSGIGDRGDNIFVSVESLWADPAGKPQCMSFTKQTLVYGDLFTSVGHSSIPTPQQPVIYAGKFGKGLESGEEIPYSEPWVRKAELSRDKFPLVLHETDFTTHSGMACIPSIWSWDWAGNDLFLKWKEDVGNRIKESRNIFGLFETIMNKTEQGQVVTKEDFIIESTAISVPELLFKPKMKYSLPRARPIGVKNIENGTFTFQPICIILNSKSAEAFASYDSGFGKGVQAIEFEELNVAKYVLYFKVESMNS
jgi:hypothetical protein